MEILPYGITNDEKEYKISILSKFNTKEFLMKGILIRVCIMIV
jgi:hypothetical protein